MPPQQRRDLRDGAAGGHHVIHQGDMPAGDRHGTGERALQIASAGRGAQPLLQSGFAHPAQGGGPVGAAQPVRQRPGQQIALVIARRQQRVACKGTAKIRSGLFRYCSLRACCQRNSIRRASAGASSGARWNLNLFTKPLSGVT